MSLGGCGEFYHLQVSSKAFKGMPMIKQHRLVQQILKEEIKGFHGIQVSELDNSLCAIPLTNH